MIRSSSDSVLNTLKGRIWLAVSVLAILNCVLGFLCYLVASYFTAEPFFTVFVTFFVLAFVTMVFGWWLSNEVTRPIETVTLLAKSLERSASASLPRTSGSAETDELLRSLHRNNRSIQNIVAAMDHVAAGRTDISDFSFESGDRMSASFQKLVFKVSESITAKQQLDELTRALKKLESEATAFRNGDLSGDIRSDEPAIKNLADTVRILASRLAKIVDRIQTASAVTERTVSDARKELQGALDRFEDSSFKLETSVVRFNETSGQKNAPLNEIRLQLNINGEDDPALGNQAEIARASADSLNHLGTLISEAAKKVHQLRSRMACIPGLGRSAHEIARRSGLISINAGLKPVSDPTNTNVPLREIGVISKRSEELQKELAAAEATIAGEITELENTFSAINNILPSAVSAMADHTDLTRRFEERFLRLATALAKAEASVNERDQEISGLIGLVEQSKTDVGIPEAIRTSDQLFSEFAALHSDLRESVADLRPGTFRPNRAVREPDQPQPTAPEGTTEPLALNGGN